MQLTDFVRARMLQSGKTMYVVAQETGIPYSCVHGFSKGKRISSDNLDLLVRYLGLWNPKRCRWNNSSS